MMRPVDTATIGAVITGESLSADPDHWNNLVIFDNKIAKLTARVLVSSATSIKGGWIKYVRDPKKSYKNNEFEA